MVVPSATNAGVTPGRLRSIHCQTKLAVALHREPRERWRLSRCDHRAIASGAATRSASGFTSNSAFAYLACFAVCYFFLTTARAVEPGPEILLWPNGVPGSDGKTGDTVVRIVERGEHVLSNIHKSSITPYLPIAHQVSGGCAVIVAPGGGHRELWSDHEGHNVARWLSERGIAAFVLKYRLAKETNSTYTVDAHALADMQRSLRLVRSRATEWGIATNRIGVMGFSAGGEVAFLVSQRIDWGAPISGAATRDGSSASKISKTSIGSAVAAPEDGRTPEAVRGNSDIIDSLPALPAFQALIYPGRLTRIEPGTNSPAAFLVCGYNDRPDISEGLATV